MAKPCTQKADKKPRSQKTASEKAGTGHGATMQAENPDKKHDSQKSFRRTWKPL
ncbi:hypothetical protein [Hyphomicrobium sp.]|uniref:hypothetical protein n=1 Tax=Hyphomicrobium sp. TaxID=82 RepID=UPI002FE232F0